MDPSLAVSKHEVLLPFELDDKSVVYRNVGSTDKFLHAKQVIFANFHHHSAKQVGFGLVLP